MARTSMVRILRMASDDAGSRGVRRLRKQHDMLFTECNALERLGRQQVSTDD
jgi:hypothetical protein